MARRKKPRVVVCGVELEAGQVSKSGLGSDLHANFTVRDNDRGTVLGWVDTEEEAIALLKEHGAIPEQV